MRIAIIGAALLAGACGGGSQERAEGPRVQRQFPVGAFERIALEGSHDVVVTVGAAPSVRAEGSERALERLEVVVENGQLHIRSRRRGGFLSFGRDRSATLHVTVPALNHVTVAGSGEMRIDRVEGRGFDGFLAGSGSLEIGRMRVETTSFDIAGSGHVRAAGTANRTDISIAGSGDADLSGLQTRTAGASVAGSGDIRLHATETVDASVSGSGDITVTGGARCSVDKHGSGEVRCG